MIAPAIRAVEYTLEHSLNGSNAWSKLGLFHIESELDSRVSVVGIATAPVLSSGETYTIRLAGTSISASIPVRCWSSIDPTQKDLILHTSSKGEAVALNFNSGSCSSEVVDEARLPTVGTIKVQRPTEVKDVSMDDIVKAMKASKVGKKSAPLIKEEEVDEEGNKKPREPPPDERTWLQKNWMVLLPLAIIVVNRLGGQ